MPIEIPMSRGHVALVDEADAAAISSYTWYPQVHRDGRVYAIRGRLAEESGPHTIRMHRQIMNAGPGDVIDHRDYNGLNNQRSNLRFATNSQNSHHRNPVKVTHYNQNNYMGVTYQRASGYYYARLVVDGRIFYSHMFSTPEAAARAWDDLSFFHYGEFCSLNFPGRKPDAPPTSAPTVSQVAPIEHDQKCAIYAFTDRFSFSCNCGHEDRQILNLRAAGVSLRAIAKSLGHNTAKRTARICRENEALIEAIKAGSCSLPAPEFAFQKNGDPPPGYIWHPLWPTLSPAQWPGRVRYKSHKERRAEKRAQGAHSEVAA